MLPLALKNVCFVLGDSCETVYRAIIAVMSGEQENETVELPADGILRGNFRISLREFLFLITIVVITIAYWSTSRKLAESEDELIRLREETGYLSPTAAGQLAAVRVPSDQPLTYRLRVRVPDRGRYRIAYSTNWEKDAVGPDWYAAIEIPSGESFLIVRIMKDPRDDRWKISTLVQSVLGTKRMATVLPQDHVAIFRGSHDVISAGVGRKTASAGQSESIRLLDEKWLVGESGLMLYGDRAPGGDQVGVFAELQPDSGPL